MPRISPGGGGVSRVGPVVGGASHSWKEVHQRVRELRRTFLHLSVKTPTDVTFRRVGPSSLRCYFLLSPGQGRESTLFYADINLEAQAWGSRIVYQEVLDSFQSFLWRNMSREELLLSERRRISTWGITNYELHPSSGTLVFPASSTIFQCVHPERPNGPVSPRELPSCQVCLSPQICPANPSLIAFAARYDIYLYNTKTGEEKRVTHVHSGSGRLEYDPKSAGMPSYVMQEEFSRYQGFWWQPVSSDGVYRLLYEEVDESEVPIVQFIPPDDSSGLLDEFRFPRAGLANAESTLRLLEVEIGASGELCVTTRHLRHDLKQLAPWHEYLVRVGWVPNGQQIWCQLLDRRQQKLELILLSLSSFMGINLSPSTSTANSTTTISTTTMTTTTSTTATNATTQSVPHMAPHLMISQHSNTWIDVHNLLYWWTSQNDPTQRMVVWASEESGFRHLYLLLYQLSSDDPPHPEDQGLVTAQLIQKIPLTSGEWSVTGTGLWVDEGRGLVYFTGLRDSPLENHLYVTSISHPGIIQRLTQSGFSHQVALDQDCTVFTTVYSSVEMPSQSQVFRITPLDTPNGSGQLVWVIALGDLVNEPLSEGLREIKSLVVPEVFTTRIASGDVVYSMVFKPHGFTPGRKYPTVLCIYGGPQVQLVTNTFKGFRHMRTHMLAANGFCVVSIDSRGSDNRGVSFQAHLMNRMGTVEIDDQVEVLELLAGQCDYLDLTRLAVTGWSYGGYLSLMALAHRPDLFRLAIAGAPVVSWGLYDTGYTERYMDLPSVNRDGYRAGSVLSYVNNLPDEENRLLIVQGMIDENVHFSHTNQLIQALIKAGKPYQLQIYPQERHCLRQLDSNEHYETKLLSFLLNHL
ncbi:dipeptidyl peptidase 8-like isoform X1 [Portunus trituberculatus]|uniref:dipeptidyl peptidase 8-like isoform X1 n=1 Tax=Portunus trituberculatus TaxID=210409 RepID=UPI001E1CE89F|nr:dipeptidyl peptidase 8-like isoform X1 [Portunus trituberculatus]XP_045123048.1 dipeptidyl peptidase 8-like isoform X1 [Portunus trituberculatus]XP_045123049.1 dipeptidyl peptidase 8-like isoform X1 [Portunus trituberculatus]